MDNKKDNFKRIAEKTVDRAKQKLIEHNTIRTGALINSIKIGEKGLDKETPYISVYADYPDLTLVNKDRKTPITNLSLESTTHEETLFGTVGIANFNSSFKLLNFVVIPNSRTIRIAIATNTKKNPKKRPKITISIG